MTTLDISLLVFAVDIEGAAYGMGDIVTVSARHFNGCRNLRFILVHVEGVPLPAPADKVLKRLKVLLEGSVSDQTFDNEIRRRAWRLDAPSTSTEVMTELITTRETVIDWELAKAFIAKRVINNEADNSLDELLFITDGDI